MIIYLCIKFDPYTISFQKILNGTNRMDRTDRHDGWDRHMYGQLWYYMPTHWKWPGHKKSYEREVTQKVRKWEQSFLHTTHCLDFIHIAMEFHSNIPYSYSVMMYTRIVCKILTRGPWWSYIAHLTKQICIFTVEVSAKFTALGFLYKLYSTNHPHPPPPHPWPCFFTNLDDLNWILKEGHQRNISAKLYWNWSSGLKSFI